MWVAKQAIRSPASFLSLRIRKRLRRIPTSPEETHMKLSVFYESNYKKDYVWLDTGDADLSIMVENDYQERLAKAKDGETVERRDPQTILNEEISKPNYNSHHKEARRQAAYDKFEEKGGLLCDSTVARKRDTNGNFCIQARNILTKQKTVEEEAIGTEEDDLYAALAAMPREQRELLLDIYADEIDQRVIASKAGVSESAVSRRKDRALARLKKELEKIQKMFG